MEKIDIAEMREKIQGVQKYHFEFAISVQN